MTNKVKFAQIKIEPKVRDNLKIEAKKRGMTLYGLLRYCLILLQKEGK